MMPVLQIGPLAVQLPGLVLIIGLWLGLSLSERYATLYQIEPNDLYNLILVTLLSGVIGARLAYVARYPTAFLHSPMSLISLNPGLLDVAGGFATAIIAGVIYIQRTRMSFWPTLDAIVPLLAVVNIAIAGANLASGNGFGAPAELPWSIQLFGDLRHPTQVYEMLLGGIILLLLLPGNGPIAKRVGELNTHGNQIAAFFILSALSRIITESFHADSTLIAFGLRRAQIAAWIFLAISLAVFAQRSFRTSSGSRAEQNS